ncbi:MAG: ABC transporter substrate-binding protein [Desulfatiglans sp.]|jgi:branched-chain amino acid transport system substrate-binding protein|nr:ABC transporter substrate-binding protein [Thermodesulfobacteriota bacterium]MEE4353123.1 ABC transporter substrate-binding protein [Desulfatiglans sp.]
MKKEFRLLVILAAALAAFCSSLILTQEVWAGQPEEIVVHHIGDITGPYAPITGSAATYALGDMQEYINKHGGIKGVKVKFIIHDTRNKRDIALAKFAEVAAQKPSIMILHQSADMEVLKARLAEIRVPAICFSPTPKTLWPKGWLFQTLPAYTDQFALFLDWLRTEWKKEGKIRLAFVNPDYPYGHSIFTPEVEAYIKKKGIDVVAKEFFPPFDVDATTHMTRVAAYSPDVIFSMTIASQPRVILKGAEAVGLPSSILYGMGCWAIDRGATKVAGGLMEGVVGVQPYWTPSDTKVPIIKEFADAFMAKKRPWEQMTMAYSAFCTVMGIIQEVLTQTVDRVGWDRLNGQEVYNTLDKSKGFQAMGFQPFQFAPGKRSSYKGRVVKIKNGDPVPITDWLPCPDMRPAKYR